MLRFPLIHPPLLAALGAAGHGGRVLLADANYSHSTNVSPAATVMRPDHGSTPPVFARYADLLGPGLPLRPLGRMEFYAECRQSDLAVCVATGDDRLFANLLLTIGFNAPQ